MNTSTNPEQGKVESIVDIFGFDNSNKRDDELDWLLIQNLEGEK